MEINLKVIYSLCCGFIGSLVSLTIGDENFLLMKILLLLMTLDYLGGLSVGFMKKSPKTKDGGLDSAACILGIFKKGGILAVIVTTHQIDLMFGQVAITDAALYAFISYECLSILENAALIGIPIPEVIKNRLTVLNKDKKVDKNSK